MKELRNVAMLYPLVSPSSPQQNEALSVIYPGRAAEDAGYEVSFFDARFDTEAVLWANIEAADVIGISSLSGYQLSQAIPIAEECKRRFPFKPIIWGGVHVTFQPVESLRESFVDFVVIGEGELRFVKLLAAIKTGRGFSQIDGIGYKKESVGFNPIPEELVAFTPRETTTGGVRLRVLPNTSNPKVGNERIEMHDADGVYDDHIVVKRRGLSLDLKTQYVHPVSRTTERLFRAAAMRNEVMLQEARGCNWSPTSCEFCSVAGQYTETDPVTGKNRSVYRPIPFEHFEKDLRAIYAIHPFTYLSLESENSSYFLKDWRYAYLLKELGIRYHLHLRSDQLINEEKVKKLAETGCDRIHIGLESGDEETLKLMRKNEQVEDHYTAAKLLAKHGIGLIGTWIIGNPGESEGSMLNTLRVSDEIRALFPADKVRQTVYVLMPLLGTLAFERAKAEGWPLPTNMKGWTEMSAAYNPNLPAWINNLYFIAGFHHNRHHKNRQNWSGWWRLLVLPFEYAIEWRWHMGVSRGDRRFFSCFAFEKKCLEILLKWRSKHSVGEGQGHVPKLLELILPGLSGH